MSAQEACDKTDIFIWEPQADGYGAIKSLVSNKYISTNGNWWQNGAYLYDQDPTSEHQKWRVYGGDQLVSMKTIDNRPGVLSHDPAGNTLHVEGMDCNKQDLHWEFVPKVVTATSDKVPTGFCKVDNGPSLQISN